MIHVCPSRPDDSGWSGAVRLPVPVSFPKWTEVAGSRAHCFLCPEHATSAGPLAEHRRAAEAAAADRRRPPADSQGKSPLRRLMWVCAHSPINKETFILMCVKWHELHLCTAAHVTLGLVREQEAGLQAFLRHDGFSVLMRGMQAENEKLRTKSAFLLLNLLMSHPEQKGMTEREAFKHQPYYWND